MSTRAAWVLPWSIWILCLALVVLTGLFAYLTPTLPERFEGYWWFPNLGFLPAVLMLVYPTIGALIALRVGAAGHIRSGGEGQTSFIGAVGGQ
jgi:hypothetical protein